MPPELFFGKSYEDVVPGFNQKQTQTINLPKSLPSLPKAERLNKSIQGNTLPTTDTLIGLQALREMKNFPKGTGYCAVVIDSGVNDHDMLESAVIGRISKNGNPDDIMDLYGHGTHIAGIIASRTAKVPGIGIAPGSEIISIKVTDEKTGSTTWSRIYNALKTTLDMVNFSDKSKTDHPVFGKEKRDLKIGVVNLSFNGLDRKIWQTYMGKQKILDIIRQLYDKDVPVVISAGNSYVERIGSGMGYPACCPYGIHVGAVVNFPFEEFSEGYACNYSQRLLSELENSSNRAAAQRYHQGFLFAAGAVSISLDKDNHKKYPYSWCSGTSIAAAQVSGTILLMQQAYKKKGKYGRIPIKTLIDLLAKGSIPFINGNPSRGAASANRFRDFKVYLNLNIANTIALCH